MADEYQFQQLVEADLPLLAQWLAKPEITRWWGEPDNELADIKEEMNDPRMAQWIVSFQDKPIAYIQDYDVHGWPVAYLANAPEGTRGIDILIGDTSQHGKGHGTAIVRQHALKLRDQGAPSVFIDPSPDNARAVRAYQKAGFTGEEIATGPDGKIVLMFFVG